VSETPPEVGEISAEISETPAETVLRPEVGDRRVRRRRREKPIKPPPPPINARNVLIYLVLAVGTTGLMVEGHLRDRPQHLPLPSLARATEVRSLISQRADSLEVVVSWDLTLSEPAGRPDSIRVRVVPGGNGRGAVSVQSATQLADTVYVPGPVRGQTLSGISCASAQHPQMPPEESCTPWQFVRPEGEPSGTVRQIVIRPSGLQVDPDVGGRCAQWQREHPRQSVWIEVNRTAVPDCTGPNRRPTVAQFCAFAILPGGKRVKASNSANDSYCEELFVEWSRELYS